MYQIFLAIISLIAAGYSLFTKQPKIGLGFIILAGAAFLLNPNLATIGVRADFYGASALVLYLFGSLVIVWKKREPKIEEPVSKEKEEEK